MYLRGKLQILRGRGVELSRFGCLDMLASPALNGLQGNAYLAAPLRLQTLLSTTFLTTKTKERLPEKEWRGKENGGGDQK